ncbi:Abi family protein [Methanimicrococcus blatticola]|uniref:Abi family protein n=1 Tax=Methanimicrococcus blatticola TaxID=91560 RepID=UPI001415162F|nr:Abi family protein [Methanimicrococcus blatticola]MBZ3936318.1 Abi family protein [Methanimicrococcus blatticola]MCC2508322.1 Abi family protein [Methanimicrococcus blatticola]
MSVRDQISLLKTRGLIITDEEVAEHFFYNNNYYRFRGYTYPFQNNTDPSQLFIGSVNFETVLDLYNFDSEFRSLILYTIEKIEIGLRTQIIYRYAVGHKNSHWHFDPIHFTDKTKHSAAILKLCSDSKNSNEEFIKHYYKTYTNPTEPPCWSSLETVTFGYLSNLFSNLNSKDPCKKEIVTYFGLPSAHILENWMHCLNNIRNICAHHSRLWNRTIAPRIIMPQNTHYLFVKNKKVYTNKIYAVLCCIQYMLNIIDSKNDFKIQLIKLLKKYPNLKLKAMGFPENWEEEEFWKITLSEAIHFSKSK